MANKNTTNVNIKIGGKSKTSKSSKTTGTLIVCAACNGKGKDSFGFICGVCGGKGKVRV
jgi:RecJ-like exonuclease